jgi:16S rRNA (adenine(1408)-N(1))-methyltransferase
LPNLLYGRLALSGAPGELAGLADELTVLLPWGSLLAAVARPDPAGLAALRALCKPGAALRIVFGYGANAEAAAIRALGLPAIDGDGAGDGAADAGPRLEAAYRAVGLSVRAHFPSLDEVRALPTTWAKRLAFSGRERRFVELRGRVW